MRLVGYVFLGIIFMSGCLTPSKSVQPAKTILEYRNFVVMPFAQSDATLSDAAFQSFKEALSQSPRVKLVGEKEITRAFVTNLGLEHPESYGALDFSAHPEGESRRQKVARGTGADGIIFGSVFLEGEELVIAVQLLDARRGVLMLNLSEEEFLKGRQPADVLPSLVRRVAETFLAAISRGDGGYSSQELY